MAITTFDGFIASAKRGERVAVQRCDALWRAFSGESEDLRRIRL